MTLVIRGLQENVKRLLKAEAARRGLKLSEAVKEAVETWANAKRDGEAPSESQVNNSLYESIIHELLREHEGKTVLVCKGKLQGVYKGPREAARELRAKFPEVKHAIITVVGMDRRKEPEWLGGSLNP